MRKKPGTLINDRNKMQIEAEKMARQEPISSPPTTRSEIFGQRDANRFASKIMTMIAEIITALTDQVLPNATAALLMFCTSSNMNAAPKQKKCTGPLPHRIIVTGNSHRRLPYTTMPIINNFAINRSLISRLHPNSPIINLILAIIRRLTLIL